MDISDVSLLQIQKLVILKLFELEITRSGLHPIKSLSGTVTVSTFVPLMGDVPGISFKSTDDMGTSTREELQTCKLSSAVPE
nr:PREDICTED: uncharacterized protein LOC104245192 isoform X2 [Nicotiana sylvestris]